MIVSTDRNKAFLAPIILIGLLIFVGTAVLLILADDETNPFKEMYLIPWVAMVGAVLSIPSLYLFYKGKFDFFHPLVFCVWTYFLPAFFVGGLILASGISKPYFMAFIEDEHYNLPLTLVYVAVGYASLSIGFFLPFGRKLTEKISHRLPVWNWNAEQVLIPGFVLLTIGVANSIFAFASGAFGYQRVDEITAFNGLIFLLTLFWAEASFLLWLAVFREKKLNFNYYLIIGVQLFITLLRYAFQGNRGGLLQVFIIITFAFVYSQRRVTVKHKIYGGVFLICAIFVGMIYGTKFRSVKETEAVVSMDKYADSVLTTLDTVAEQDLGNSIEQGIEAIAERLESVSTLAVVVSNYEKLEPYEESYGLDNNIYKDSVTFFVPRPLWADKPAASDPRKYSALYFNFGESSFGITPMGDLLRNFGPYGVVFGMLFLGMFIRFFYSALIEDKEFSYWRTTVYYMLLTGVSYEGFYGVIIPYVLKVGFVSFIGILLVKFLVKKNYSKVHA